MIFVIYFRGEYIHLGGDEVSPESWKSSPAVEALKNEIQSN